ncbi:MAG: hypothetical protein OXE46_08495 [Chloroflexi bacterium]|nr:hypothetical protein [Chloroflexota bacterium]
MRGWLTVLAFAGLVALIGAAVGLATSDLRADGGLAGALIGAIIGSWLGLRMQAHRAAISRARQDPQEALH